MAFRADEAAANGLQRLKNRLIPRQLSVEDRERCEEAIDEITDECGPAVDAYPTWHPLVAKHDGRSPVTYPSERCGYHGLDHTFFLAHGFITCPYGDGQEVIDSVENLRPKAPVAITAEKLDVPFYGSGTTAVLVRCEWSKHLDAGMQVPKSLAVPLMIEQELPNWRWAEVGETWETMRPYLLGSPNGKRSSLFVSQETALAMKKVFVAMIESGMYGPVRM
jgi:hypothetical protein